jgi:hypothetical protein
MIVTLCSAKGAPGVTTTAALLALTWPRPAVLVEADPSGGSLVAHWANALDVSYEPGLISLAATRDPIDTATTVAHTQPIGERARLLGAPPHPRQVRTALASVADRLASAPDTNRDFDTIVDCGRLDPTSPAMPFVHRADVVLLVVRPRLADIAVAETTVTGLRGVAGVQLLCVGDSPYRATDVAAHLDLPLAGILADDEQAATFLALHGPTGRGLTRSPLWRSASELSRTLTASARVGIDAEARIAVSP